MRATPEDMGPDRTRQMDLAQRSLHCAGGNQYHFRLANLGASYDPGVPVEHDVKKQACRGCGVWLRPLVSWPLRSSAKSSFIFAYLHSSPSILRPAVADYRYHTVCEPCFVGVGQPVSLYYLPSFITLTLIPTVVLTWRHFYNIELLNSPP